MAGSVSSKGVDFELEGGVKAVQRQLCRAYEYFKARWKEPATAYGETFFILIWKVEVGDEK